MVGTGGHFFESNSIGGYQGQEPVKIGEHVKNVRRWSLYNNMVFIYLSLIVEKLKSFWNRWRGSTAMQSQDQ